MITAGLRYLVCGFAAGVAAIACSPADATDASTWQADTYSAVRLIAGARPSNSRLAAGVEVRLKPGWKTYWRYPGDSGAPPRFDFAQSTNVQSVRLSWPAPHRFTDETGSTIGYKNSVIFPLEITPLDPKKPVSLRLALDYAVCEKLCVPAKADAELALTDEVSFLASAVTTAEAHVPKHAQVGDDGAIGIRAVGREMLDGHDRVVVDVAAPDIEPVELFAEGPTPDWSLPLPDLVSAAPAGLRRFVFELDGLPPGATSHGATLTLTLVAGDHAIEVSTRLD